MDISEWEEGTECAECGEPVDEGTAQGFPFGDRWVLCFECATERGGQYDAEQDRWVNAPNLEGLEAIASAARGPLLHSER